MPGLVWTLGVRDAASPAWTRFAAATDKAAAASARLSTKELEASRVASRLKIAQLEVAAATERHGIVAASTTASVTRQAQAEIGLIRATQGLAEAQSASATAAAKAAVSHSAAGKAASVGASLTRKLTVPIVGLGAIAIHEAMQFEKGLTTVQVATGRTNAEMEQSYRGLLAISRETATGTDKLTDSYYVASKAGLSVTQSLAITRAAAQGAKAENADLGIVTNALTSIMASYGSKLKDPVAAMNMLVRGAGLAKTSTQDYAGSLSTVVPLAAKAGLGFDQVAGALATLTQHGTSAQQATQEMAFTIRNLQAPNNVAVSAMNQLGISAVDVSKNLGQRGLTGTFDFIASKLPKSALVYVGAMKKMEAGTSDLTLMQSKMAPSLAAASQKFLDGTMTQKAYKAEIKGLGAEGYSQGASFMALAEKVRGYSDSVKNGTPAQKTAVSLLKQMMGGAEGLNTWLQLTGESADYFAKATGQVGDAAKTGGKDVLGFSEAQKTAAFKSAALATNIKADVIELGTNLLPIFAKVVTGITKAVQWFDSLSSGTKKFIGVAVLIGAALGPVLSIFSRLTRGYVLLYQGMQKLTGGAGKSAAAVAEAQKMQATAVQASTDAQILATTELTAALTKLDVAEQRSALSSVRASERRALAARAEAATVTGARAVESRSAGIVGGGVVGSAGRSRFSGGGLGSMAIGAGAYFGGQALGGMISGNSEAGSGRNMAGTAVKYAGAGAAIGSLAGPEGIVIGAALGAGVGALKSYLSGLDKVSAGMADFNAISKQADATTQSFANDLLAGGKDLAANQQSTAQGLLAQSKIAERASYAGLTQKDLTNAITGSDAAYQKLVDTWKASGQPSNDTLLALYKMREEFLNGAKEAQKYADAHGVALAQEVAQGSQVDVLSGKLGNLNKLHLTGAQTAANYQQQMSRLTQTIAFNGQTLDADTSFGQHNIAAIRMAASASLEHAQAVYQQTGSLAKADDALRSDRDQLLATAKQAGLSKDPVNALADAIVNIPADKTSTITVDTSAATRALSDFGAFYDSYLANLSNKVVTGPSFAAAPTPKTVGTQGTLITGGHANGSNGKLPPGYSTVGERGWELVKTDASGRSEVVEHNESMRLTGLPDRLPGFASGTKKTYQVGHTKYTSQLAAQNATARADAAKVSATTSAASALAGVVADVSASFDQVRTAAAALVAAAKAQGASAQLLSYAGKAQALLTDRARQRDAVRTRLGTAPTPPTAYDNLGTAKNAYDSSFTTVRDAVAAFDPTAAPQAMFNDVGGGPSPASFLTRLTATASKASAFAGLLKTLISEGMPRSIVEQLAAAGPAAYEQAKALSTATPAQILAIKQQSSILSTAASAAGTTVADGYYKAGVDSAQGIVNGLLSQESALNKAIAQLGDGMIKTLKGKLGIHSPSKVTRALGQFTGAGFVLGLQDQITHVARASDNLSAAAVPNVAPHAGNSGGSYSGGDTNHYWTINEADNGMDTAHRVMRRLAFAGP